MGEAREMMSFKVMPGDVQRFRLLAFQLSINLQRRVTQTEIMNRALGALEREMAAELASRAPVESGAKLKFPPAGQPPPIKAALDRELGAGGQKSSEIVSPPLDETRR